MRVAIKTLFYAVTGEGKDIAESFDRAQRGIYLDLVSDLNDRNLLMLKSAYRCPEKFVKKVFQRYEALSRRHSEAS